MKTTKMLESYMVKTHHTEVIVVDVTPQAIFTTDASGWFLFLVWLKNEYESWPSDAMISLN